MDRIKGALHLFITNGHRMGVLLGKRVESAAIKLFGANQQALNDATDIESTAHKVTNHLMHHFSMLRDLKQESVHPGGFCRRYPKTG